MKEFVFVICMGSVRRFVEVVCEESKVIYEVFFFGEDGIDVCDS